MGMAREATTVVLPEEPYMKMAEDPYMKMNEDPYMKMNEDPYMRMKRPPMRILSHDAYMPMQTHTLPKKHQRRQSEETMFRLEDNSGSPFKVGQSPEKMNNCIYSEKTFPRRKKKMSLLTRTAEQGERNSQILHGSLMKQPFRKGNKHKDDYVYVDFEKQNYMDMAQTGSNKWKFLNFSGK